MKIFEIMDGMSPYVDTMQTLVIDYLSALRAQGIEKVKTAQVSSFLSHQGHDVQPDQLMDILDGSDYTVTVDEIEMKKEEPEGDMNALRSQEHRDQTVKNMAGNQISKGLRDD